MPEVSACISIRKAAAAVGVVHGTLRAAIKRHELAAHELADGTPVLVLADVEEWASADRRGAGRPRKAGAAAHSEPAAGRF